MCIYYIGMSRPYMRLNSVTAPVTVNEIPEVKPQMQMCCQLTRSDTLLTVKYSQSSVVSGCISHYNYTSALYASILL